MPEDLKDEQPQDGTEGADFYKGLDGIDNPKADRLRGDAERSREVAERNYDEIDRGIQRLNALQNAKDTIIDLESSSLEPGDNEAIRKVWEILETARLSEDKKYRTRRAARDDVELGAEVTDLRAEKHFRDNEEGYKQQAVKEATADGVDVQYPPYTGEAPPRPPTFIPNPDHHPE